MISVDVEVRNRKGMRRIQEGRRNSSDTRDKKKNPNAGDLEKREKERERERETKRERERKIEREREREREREKEREKERERYREKERERKRETERNTERQRDRQRNRQRNRQRERRLTSVSYVCYAYRSLLGSPADLFTHETMPLNHLLPIVVVPATVVAEYKATTPLFVQGKRNESCSLCTKGKVNLLSTRRQITVWKQCYFFKDSLLNVLYLDVSRFQLRRKR